MDYDNMSKADKGVLCSTWGWRLKKLGFKNARAFCEEHDIPEAQFSLWINGKQEPMPHNIKKVEDALGPADA